MKILGRAITHDNSASLMIDGKIHTAIATERLTRQKYECRNNDLSIQYCLNNAMINISDIDYIVQNSPKHYFPMEDYGELIKSHQGNVFTISHHLAHAYACYGLSPFEEAVIMVIDGRGNFVPNKNDLEFRGNEFLNEYIFKSKDELDKWAIEVESYYYAENKQISLIEKTCNRGAPETIGVKISSRLGKFPDEFSGYYQYMGLGAMYEQVTEHIFGHNLLGGKVMGLAPYGDPHRFNFDMVELTNNGFKIKTDWLHLFTNKPPIWNLDYSTSKDLAAKVQYELERALIHKANILFNRTKCKNLCISGGVGLNSVANKKILDNTPFENIYIQPACNDTGISMGCAFWANYKFENINKKKKIYHQVDYYGKAYSDAEVLNTLKKFENKSLIAFSRKDEIEKRTAQLIAQGKIIGWFQGKSEFGPRALGNRSILADPRDPKMKDRLNKRVKFREEFRPFAPSILEEYSNKYFDLEYISPFMLLVAKVKSDEIPAVTHIDNSARIQTVNIVQNEFYYKLINEFFNITNIPVLLNTSFNIKGEPIVETPEDALICFLDTEIDYLIINDYFIEKKIRYSKILTKHDFIELKESVTIGLEKCLIKRESQYYYLNCQMKSLVINSIELKIVNKITNKVLIEDLIDEFGEGVVELINKLNKNGMIRIFVE